MSSIFDNNNKIWNRSLEDIMSESFGKYAKYIIQDRALPDIRDGLKPVQRRILYAMNELKIHHDKPYKKSARTVGEVIGKYHPHGDSSIYEAMVRMSQEWKNNIPLLDMQGNKGSLDGDGPAAMRYTECRLSQFGELMLDDIEKAQENQDKEKLNDLLAFLVRGKHEVKTRVSQELLEQIKKNNPEVWEEYQKLCANSAKREKELEDGYSKIIETEL